MLKIMPCTLKSAQKFVTAVHRHHRAPLGGLFAVACGDGVRVRGVAIVGRPVARRLQDGNTAEVTRLATDGTKNACSILYAACWRAARALGYRRMITYILESEPGTSLRAAGWTMQAVSRGGSWSRQNRTRVDDHPTGRKQRWEVLV